MLGKRWSRIELRTSALTAIPHLHFGPNVKSPFRQIYLTLHSATIVGCHCDTFTLHLTFFSSFGIHQTTSQYATLLCKVNDFAVTLKIMASALHFSATPKHSLHVRLRHKTRERRPKNLSHTSLSPHRRKPCSKDPATWRLGPTFA